MSVATRQYSLRPSALFLWDMDEGRVRMIVPFLNDAPAPIGTDDAQVKKREKLLFHIHSGDYFGVLATALGFVEDALHSSVRVTGKRAAPSEEVLLVRDLRDDLRYLHDNYDICPKKSDTRRKRST